MNFFTILQFICHYSLFQVLPSLFFSGTLTFLQRQKNNFLLVFFRTLRFSVHLILKRNKIWKEVVFVISVLELCTLQNRLMCLILVWCNYNVIQLFEHLVWSFLARVLNISLFWPIKPSGCKRLLVFKELLGLDRSQDEISSVPLITQHVIWCIIRKE